MNDKLALLKEFNRMKIFTDKISIKLNKQLEESFNSITEYIDNIFNDQISPYIINLYEFDNVINDLIEKKFILNDDCINKLNSAFKRADECEKEILNLINDIKKIVSSDEIEKYNKKIINDTIKECNISNKTLLIMIQQTMYRNTMEMIKMMKLYCSEQLEFFNNLDNIFEFKLELTKKHKYVINNNYMFNDCLQKDNIKRFVCTYDDMKNFLINIGYKKIRQNGTSHAIYKNTHGKSIPLPNKKGEMAPSTISLILNQCGYKRNDLGKFINGEEF